MSEPEKQPTAPDGATQASADYFTGIAWVKMLVSPNDPTDCVVGDVTFEPGARNNWHTHPHGQILVVTSGTGYYQEKGQPVRVLHPGDAVSIAPDVNHWHGATPDSRFTHLAINPSASKGTVTWGAPVTDEEYQAVQA
jgi:quercetin dioxygenase-like cupin family protein